MNPIYDIPNMSLYSHRAELPVSTSSWRGLGLLANTFATESFVDELAVIAGKDPLSFRMEHLTGEVGERVRTVLDSVAGLASWPGVADHGSAMGVACCIDYGTIVAQIAQVKVENGDIRVTRIWAAMDAGLVVNPDGATNQVQGNIIWGLGSALKEAIVFKEGKPSASNFGGYPLLRMDEVPDIVVDLIPSDRPPQGVGEPAIGPVPAAVANAVFAATGVRVRELPLTL
jgi:isoquinoline 1-oxidoreductase beta subunit